MSSTKTVLGLVRNQTQADAIVRALLTTGFARTDVSTLRVNAGPGALDSRQGVPGPDHTTSSISLGSLIGTTLGLFVGFGLLVVPGSSPLFAAGPIVAVLGGALAGAMMGGVTGGVVGMGISSLEAQRYETRLRGGAILLSIHVDDRDQRAHAKKILAGFGATNVGTIGERYVGEPLAPALVSS